MSKHKKLIERFLTHPVDFTWNELTAMLGVFGYEIAKGGKTGGLWVHFNIGRPIRLFYTGPIQRRY